MNRKLLRFFIVFAFAKALLSCNSGNKIEEEISGIPLDVELVRFHEEFADAKISELPQLKSDYPLLFSPRIADSIWESKMIGTDTIQQVLEKAVSDADFDFERMEQDLENVMRHVKYYFPEFKPTPIVTIISDVNYRQKVVPTQNQLLISIDTYLGKDHELYTGINKYHRDHMNVEQLPADVALGYASLFVEPTMDRSLIGHMIYHGKKHYLQELFAPNTSGDLLFNFTPEKYQFTLENESQMWRFFIDNELLYETDSRLLSNFILPGPFSKFGLEVDQQTPSGVGRYLGYRMVKSFMENNEVDLETMLQLNAVDIFKRSKYKPLQ